MILTIGVHAKGSFAVCAASNELRSCVCHPERQRGAWREGWRERISHAAHASRPSLTLGVTAWRDAVHVGLTGGRTVNLLRMTCTS